MPLAADPNDVESAMRQLDGLLQEVDQLPDPAAREHTGRIIQGLLAFHGAGLRNILGRIARAGEPGRALIDELARDELVGSLLLLYDLHPMDMPARVEAALERVRPSLASHGGDVQLLGVTAEGVVRLAMRGNCHGCPSSAATLKMTVERAIYEAAPDAAAVHVDAAGGTDGPGDPTGPGDPPRAATAGAAGAGFVPVEQLTARLATKRPSLETHSRQGVIP